MSSKLDFMATFVMKNIHRVLLRFDVIFLIKGYRISTYLEFMTIMKCEHLPLSQLSRLSLERSCPSNPSPLL